MSAYTKTFYPLMDIIIDIFREQKESEFEFKTKNGTIKMEAAVKQDLKNNEFVALTLSKVEKDENEDCDYDLIVTEDTTSGQIRHWLKCVSIL